MQRPAGVAVERVLEAPRDGVEHRAGVRTRVAVLTALPGLGRRPPAALRLRRAEHGRAAVALVPRRPAGCCCWAAVCCSSLESRCP